MKNMKLAGSWLSGCWETGADGRKAEGPQPSEQRQLDLVTRFLSGVVLAAEHLVLLGQRGAMAMGYLRFRLCSLFGAATGRSLVFTAPRSVATATPAGSVTSAGSAATPHLQALSLLQALPQPHNCRRSGGGQRKCGVICGLCLEAGTTRKLDHELHAQTNTLKTSS